MEIKPLTQSEIDRIREIDRTEHVTVNYSVADGQIVSQPVDIHVPRWFDDDSPHGVARKIKEWSPILKDGGLMFGAFDEDILAGIIILRPKLAETMAQLAVLHISQKYRRQGIGEALTAHIIEKAKTFGATHLYVSAAPTQSAVNFYLKQGFQLTEKVHPELYALEPEDIHMIMAL